MMGSGQMMGVDRCVCTDRTRLLELSLVGVAEGRLLGVAVGVAVGVGAWGRPEGEDSREGSDMGFGEGLGEGAWEVCEA